MIRVDDRDDLNWIQGPGRGSDSPELRPPALSGPALSAVRTLFHDSNSLENGCSEVRKTS